MTRGRTLDLQEKRRTMSSLEDQVRLATFESYQEALRGRFDEAFERLRPHRDHAQSEYQISNLRAQARIQVIRGHARQALECLDKALAFSNSSLSHMQLLRLDIHRLFVGAVCCGEPHLRFDVLLEAAAVLSQLNTLQDYCQEDLEMLSQVYCITHLRQTLFGTQPDKIVLDLQAILPALMTQAIDLREWSKLYALVRPYCLTTSSLEVVRCFEIVLNDVGIPDILRAYLDLELVDQLATLARYDRLASCLTDAEAAYHRCQHRFGSSMVRRYRLEHGLQPSSNVLQDLISILVEYHQAEYFFGVLRVASTPLRLAFDRADFDLYVQLQLIFHAVCESAGMKHERLLLEVQLLATVNLSTGHNGRALELGQAVWTESLAQEYWNIAYNAGRALSLAYNQAGQSDKAEELARAILAVAESHQLPTASEAEYHLASILSMRTDIDKRSRVELCKQIITQLALQGNDATELACLKLQMSAQMALELCRTEVDAQHYWTQQMFLYIQSNHNRAQQLTGQAKLDATGNCVDVHITYLLWRGRLQPHRQDEDEAIRLCDELIRGYNEYGDQFRVAIKHMFRASCHLQKYQKSRLVADILASDSDYGKAGDIFELINMLSQVLNARHCQIRNHMELLHGLKGFSSVTIYLLLDHTEAIIDKLRLELSALGTLEALLAKQRFAHLSQIQDIYQWAVHITLKEGRYDQVWLWSQKRKARSVSDILGLGVLIPEATKRSIDADADAESRVLLEELQSLGVALNAAPKNEKIYLRQRIESIETRLRKHPAVDQYLRLRDGTVVGISQLALLREHDMKVNRERATIFADFVIQKDLIFVLTYNCADADQGQLHDTGLHESQVRLWLEEHFATEDQRRHTLTIDSLWAEDRPLRTLDPLVAPFAKVSKPGDLLVLSVTGSLAHLPLHVLGIPCGRKPTPLIERNAIVYTPSFSTLATCLTRSTASKQPGKSLFAYAFDHAGELQAIEKQISLSARLIDEQALTSTTKADFKRHVEQAPSLIHFHGHCIFNAENILSQALVFAATENGDTATAPSSEPPLMSTSVSTSSTDAQATMLHEQAGSQNLLHTDDRTRATHVTVEDVFQLNLTANPLMVTIACHSSSQVVSAGDEPIGLISGFLCAGASSIIATAWTVPSITGRVFSTAFYEYLSTAGQAGQPNRLVDVAVALQQAVLAVRDHNDESNERSMSSTYHWGSFCLNGSWTYSAA